MVLINMKLNHKGICKVIALDIRADVFVTFNFVTAILNNCDSSRNQQSKLPLINIIEIFSFFIVRIFFSLIRRAKVSYWNQNSSSKHWILINVRCQVKLQSLIRLTYSCCQLSLIRFYYNNPFSSDCVSSFLI